MSKTSKETPIEQRVANVIQRVLAVYDECAVDSKHAWVTWAKGWLDGSDRSGRSAFSAEDAASTRVRRLRLAVSSPARAMWRAAAWASLAAAAAARREPAAQARVEQAIAIAEQCVADAERVQGGGQ